jgi:PAS domain S-box-containing protein
MEAKERIRILAVEDDPHDGAALLRCLQRAQCCEFELMLHERAEHALAAIEEDCHAFDVALIDYMLPGMDGMAAGERMLGLCPELPLVLLTGEGSEELAVAALHVGFMDYIVKGSNAGYLTLLPAKIYDVVLRGRREAEHRRAQERYARLVEHSPDVFYTLSAETGRLFVSSRASQVIGYTPEYLTAHPRIWCESVHEQDKSALDEALEGMRRGVHYCLDYRLRRADGEWIWLRDRSIGIVGQGMAAVVSGVAVDVTEEKKLEFMKQSFEMVTRHDLKSPLSAIIGLSRLLAEECDDGMRETAMAVNASATNMMLILNRWMDLYKMEAGIFEPVRTEVDVDEIVQSAVNDLLHQPWFEHRTLKTDPAPAKVLADPVLLYNTVTNLLKNALEAGGDDTPVTLRYLLGTQTVTLAFHNEQGMSDEAQEHFFDKFHSKGKAYGTGLGTYSAKLMTEIMGGQIRMETSRAEGTTVYVTLPLP